MELMQKISVVIPTYNRCSLLLKSIESVLCQTYPVHEVLVCDDGSDDDSSLKVELLSAVDNRVRWVPCGKSGRPSIPRNIGINNCTGDWIAFLDSDDTWHPTKINEQIESLHKTKLLASCTNAFKINSQGKNLGTYLSYSNKFINLNNLIDNNWVICSSVMIHNSLFAITEGFPESLEFKAIEDYALWLKIATCTDIIFLDKNLVNYLDAPQSSIRKTESNYSQQKLTILKGFIYWIFHAKTIRFCFLIPAFKNYLKVLKHLWISNLKISLQKFKIIFI